MRLNGSFTAEAGGETLKHGMKALFQGCETLRKILSLFNSPPPQTCLWVISIKYGSRTEDLINRTDSFLIGGFISSNYMFHWQMSNMTHYYGDTKNTLKKGCVSAISQLKQAKCKHKNQLYKREGCGRRQTHLFWGALTFALQPTVSRGHVKFVNPDLESQ